MSYREIRRILGFYFYFYAIILVIPFLLSLYFRLRISDIPHPQPHSVLGFSLAILICIGLSWLLKVDSGRVSAFSYRHKEALVSVVLIWIITPAIGALPFYLSGTIERFDQAYFEATSGFTTTGSTILEAKKYDPETGEEIPISRSFNGVHKVTYTYYGTVTPIKDALTGKMLNGIEAVSPSLLFWRSFMQWIGGLGIIVLFVAFLPELGIQNKLLYQTEATGPVKEGFKPRIKETAIQLWLIYIGLTFLQIFCLFTAAPDISLFDAVTLSFSTLSTGGFSIHNSNVGYYQQNSIVWIVLIFMILGSINFTLYYHVLKGKFYRLFDTELRCYLIFLSVLGGLVIYGIWKTPEISLEGVDKGNFSLSDAIRIGLFHCVSFESSSGFCTAMYDTWPYAVQVILVMASYLGGMSGSTAGGIKISRIQILYQATKARIESIFQPRTIKRIYLGGREVSEASAYSVFGYFFIVIAVSAFATLIYVYDHIDLQTSFSLTTCMVNNLGAAFNAAGSTNSMAFLSPFSTFFSSFLMILGRLEFYAFFAILVPSFWRRY